MAPSLPIETRPASQATLMKNLEKIYESGEFSDLTISTATRNFSVHKNIVCPACPFFQAACTRDFEEAHTGVIKLPESAEVVDGLLRHIYGLPIPAPLNIAGIHGIRFRLDLHICADKYDFPELRADVKQGIITEINKYHNTHLVDFGLYLYEQDVDAVDPEIATCLVRRTAACMGNIMSVVGSWELLASQPELIKAVMLQIVVGDAWPVLRDELGESARAMMITPAK